MIKYEIITGTPPITIEYIQEVASSKEERQILIDKGVHNTIQYIEKWNSKVCHSLFLFN